MRKHKLFLIGVFAALFAASSFVTACKGANDLPKPAAETKKPEDTKKPDEKKDEKGKEDDKKKDEQTGPGGLHVLKTDAFKNPPAGTTGYKITWTDAKGTVQTKTVTLDEVKSDITLPGGIKAGTKAKIVPIVKNADGTVTENQSAATEAEASTNTDSKPYIQAGINELSKDKPDFDAALAQFKDAYTAEKNNTTKAYYAAVQLATISVKQETVNFMRNRIGFATYPQKLNALASTEWFKTYTETHRDSEGKTYEFSYKFPEMQPAADWYKGLPAYLQIPAYIVEHSNSANVDQLIDELYGILFGAEFTNAESLLNSLDAKQPVTIDKKLVKLLGMSGEKSIFPEDTDVEWQKEQLLGVIGSLTVAKGVFEFLQSYSFNTDLNILKWNWEKNDNVLNNLGSYNVKQDPFNNGFLKGRSQQKIIDAKADMVKGADLLLGAYKSLTESATLPAKAKEAFKKEAAFIQAMVKEIRDAIAEGRKANILIGEDNPMKANLQAFTIDMGKVFTYEYFKLSNLFEMNGNKPKIYSEGGKRLMKMKLKPFMEDFVTITLKNGKSSIHDQLGAIPLELTGSYGDRIINFYK